MKMIYALLVCLLSVSLFSSCEKDGLPETVTEESLLSAAQHTKMLASQYMLHSYIDISETKSMSEESGLPLVVPEWAYEFIKDYLTLGYYDDNDLKESCSILEKQQDLSYEQKEYIAYILGALDFLKQEAYSVIIETKADQSDCLSVYKNAVTETLSTDVIVGAIGGGCVGGIIGAELGIIGGLISAWRGIRQAGRDYIRCVA